MVMPGLWIYLIILRVPQAFEDAWGSKYASSEYGTVLYVRVAQNSEYDWIWLNTPK